MFEANTIHGSSLNQASSICKHRWTTGLVRNITSFCWWWSGHVTRSQPGWTNITPGSHVNCEIHILFSVCLSGISVCGCLCFVQCTYLNYSSFFILFTFYLGQTTQLNLCFLSLYAPPFICLFTVPPSLFYMVSGVWASLQVREVSSEGEIRAQKGQRRWEK